MTTELVSTLRTWQRMPAAELLRRLGVSRATMMRAIRAAGEQVVVRGGARRTAYAARRALRGSLEPLPLYRVDSGGRVEEVGHLDLIYPHGCALAPAAGFEWPLPGEMRDGWFDGLPWMLDDMRPQGFLGRHFARTHAELLHVPADPLHWSEDDAFYALSLFGADMPGNYILGESACRRFLESLQEPAPFLSDEELPGAYERMAAQSLATGEAGSSAGGEFPKFLARRLLDGEHAHVIVKFSGDDTGPGTQRWSDLLVCEQLAAEIVEGILGISAAKGRACRFAKRTFLEVPRFDRCGQHGRAPVCTWAPLNAALFGLGGKDWSVAAARLHESRLISTATRREIEILSCFGHLVANTDMHDGNLAFQPGKENAALVLAPVYDMLPMGYAPRRGVELPSLQYTPKLPLPAQRAQWLEAARAATLFWEKAAGDARITAGFREICKHNAQRLRQVAAQVV